MEKRKRADWVIEPEDRLQILQLLGGELYDLIDEYYIIQSDGSKKELLTFIREETHMADPTLQRVFLGKSVDFNNYLRVLFAINDVASKDFVKVWQQLGDVIAHFGREHGEEYLELQRELHRPKKKHLSQASEEELTTKNISEIISNTNIYKLWQERTTKTEPTNCSSSIPSDSKTTQG